MGSKFGLCNSRLKQRFVTKRVHLKLPTDENSFDLERGEAGGGQNLRYLRAVNGVSHLPIHVIGMHLYLGLRISVNFFRCVLPLYSCAEKFTKGLL
jgi:hypothetical protein